MKKLFPRLLIPVLSLSISLWHTGSDAASPSPSPSQGRSAEPEPIAPIKAPFDMPQLTRPQFPNFSVNIRQFGAQEGKKNTDAIRKAIEACAAKGGGHVLIPKGQWLTGAIHLKSNIDLHLEDGAELVFSDQPEDYLPPVFVRSGGIELYNYSPLIYARDCQNIAVTGSGVLNGNGKAWWGWVKKESRKPVEMARNGVPVEQRVFGTKEEAIRPNFVSFIGCKNVLLEGFTITSGPMWTIHPIYCDGVIIRRVNLDTHGPNNDGIDPDSCKNVLVEYCAFNTGDDCMVIKSGYNEDGWRVNRPSENLVMRHCTGKLGHGGLVIGSEMSGGVRNVFMHDCQFDGTDHAIRIKSRADRGGFVENVWAENVQGKDLKRDVIIITMDYRSDHSPIAVKKWPDFRNFHFKNIAADNAPAAIIMDGGEGAPVQNVWFESLKINSEKGVSAKDIKGIEFKNVQITPQRGPVYSLENASEVTILSSKVASPLKEFLLLEGKGSAGVLLESCDLSNVAEPVKLGQGVLPSAVTRK